MAKKKKLERNEFGAPVGVQLDSDAANKLHLLRHKKALKQLDNKALKAGRDYFLDKYPDPEGSDDTDEVSFKEMKAKLKEHDVSFGNTSGNTIKDKYNELLAELEADSNDNDLTVEEMKKLLVDQGRTISPGASDESITEQYEKFLAESE